MLGRDEMLGLLATTQRVVPEVEYELEVTHDRESVGGVAATVLACANKRVLRLSFGLVILLNGDLTGLVPTKLVICAGCAASETALAGHRGSQR